MMLFEKICAAYILGLVAVSWWIDAPWATTIGGLLVAGALIWDINRTGISGRRR